MDLVQFKKPLFICLVIFLFLAILSFALPFLTISKDVFLANVTEAILPQATPTKLASPPKILQSIYATGWSAGSRNYQKYLSYLAQTTSVNAVVIDIKDVSGIVSYRTNAPLAKKYQAYWPQIKNIDALINNLHQSGFYVIGRIAVFQDDALARRRPDLAIYNIAQSKNSATPVLWGNNNGLHWVDPASEEVWDYNIEIARDALNHGFDEINFDYVRFPTDGNLKNMGFPSWDKKTVKSVVMENFFKKVRQELPEATLSADLFGLATVSNDDLGIGQILEKALPYFDYVCPMIYPSHFASGFLGFKNPADYPYEVIKYSMDGALFKHQMMQENTKKPLAKIRPWIQDFNLGAVYDASMVSAQIKAVSDALGADYVGFMLWSPSNIYTAEALIPSEFAKR